MMISIHSTLQALFLIGTFVRTTDAVIATTLRGGGGNHPNDRAMMIHSHNDHHRVLQEGQMGTFLISEIEYEGHALPQLGEQQLFPQQQTTSTSNNRTSRKNNIQLADGTIYEVKNAQTGWTNDLKSGKYRVQIPPGSVVSSDGFIDVKGKKLNPTAILARSNEYDLFDRTLSSSAVNNEGEQGDQHRILQTATRTILVVRVLLEDGQYSHADQTGLSNDVFGNGVDTVNLKSQYAACSANKLIFEKSANRTMTSNPNDGTTSISNGVVDIKVALNKTAGDVNVRNAVTTKLNSVFGVTSPTQLANHVMYCLPTGTMSGIAYAFINSWMSVYSNQWCNYVSAQMHEIGHNLGYAHSNEGGTAYADQTGMMGYSYSNDDGPIMCFNAAKSWQTQWYATKSTVIDPSAGKCFEGNLYGIADFSNAASPVVLIKIDDSTDTDFYVTFNRQIGVNSGTVEGGNTVTVTKAGGEGTSYAESDLLAKLTTSGTWTGLIDGKNMMIQVLGINVSVSPAYATVRISENGNACLGGQVASNAPTNSPTRIPTMLPTNLPTHLPTTISPTRIPTTLPTNSPTSTPSRLPTAEPSTASPSMSQTTVPPSVSPTSAPSRLPTADDPTISASPSSSPTVSPSSLSPTEEVPSTTTPTTVSPTILPSTFSPTDQPTTLSPTIKPTTLTPTGQPTNLPISTSMPTTSPSTRLPTNSPTRNPTRLPTRRPTRRPK